MIWRELCEKRHVLLIHDNILYTKYMLIIVKNLHRCKLNITQTPKKAIAVLTPNLFIQGK